MCNGTYYACNKWTAFLFWRRKKKRNFVFAFQLCLLISLYQPNGYVSTETKRKNTFAIIYRAMDLLNNVVWKMNAWPKARWSYIDVSFYISKIIPVCWLSLIVFNLVASPFYRQFIASSTHSTAICVWATL